MKIKKNDKVIIIAGKDKGKIGKVLHALPDADQLIVEGVNIKNDIRNQQRVIRKARY